MTDADREKLIAAWSIVVELGAPSYKQIAFDAMKAEINRRSSQQVQKMEQERGLR